MGKRNDTRGVRDQAGVGPDAGQTRHLVPLKEVKDFRIASGEPDIRGWDVYTSTGRELGEVDDLLIDPTRNEVVMLDIDLKGTDRHSLAPLRAAWIDREHKRVVLNSAEFRSDADVPTLGRSGPLTESETREFSDRYGRAYGDRGWDRDDEYSIRRPTEDLRFRRRPDSDAAADVAAGTTAAATPTAGRVEHAADQAADRATGDRADADRRAREVIAHRRDANADAAARTAGLTPGRSYDVRYPAEAERASGASETRSLANTPSLADTQPLVVEETIVRRRVVDPSELSAADRERLARDAKRGSDAD
ncbi:MAG: PRC-barrel domain-containing protein [Gemmatimonadaceae bacterium]